MSGFVRSLWLDGLPEDEPWLAEIPAVQALLGGPLELDPRVTFLVGENGSGKQSHGESFLDIALNRLVATHSPILVGYPHATILRLGDDGIEPIEFDEAEQVDLTRSFLADRERFLNHLLGG